MEKSKKSYKIAIVLICIVLLVFFFKGINKNENKDIDMHYPTSFMVTGENYFDYQPKFECAAFSSAYLLRYYGKSANGLELFKTFPGKLSNDGGVYPLGIKTFFELQGYEVEFVQDGTVEQLKSELSKGAPVIVFIHVLYPYTSPHSTHYVPLVGYDQEYFYFAESLEDLANCKDETGVPYNRKTKISDFKNLWNNIDGAWDEPFYIITPKN